jgi:hypothetical protein
MLQSEAVFVLGVTSLSLADKEKGADHSTGAFSCSNKALEA